MYVKEVFLFLVDLVGNEMKLYRQQPPNGQQDMYACLRN